MKRRLAVFTASLLLAAFPACADPQSLGAFQAWSAYSAKEGNETICYISSRPAKSEGDYKKRNPVFAEVTDRPAEHRAGVFNILAGYSLKPGAPAVLEIGRQKFSLFTHGDAAFAQDADDPKIVAAMKGADAMVFHGTSSKGTASTDVFSLKGMGAAYAAIGKACGAKGK